MSSKPYKIHAAIISWHGMETRARQIAEALEGRVARLSIVYSRREGPDLDGPGTWLRVPDDHFYGRKFAASLAATDADETLLQINADATTDWGHMIDRLGHALERFPNLGIWTGNVDWSPWSHEITEIERLPCGEFLRVAKCDGVLWAMTPPIVERMRAFDYTCNNFGWGVEVAAVAYSWAEQRDVLCDLRVKVVHPKRSGYSRQQAERQMKTFLRQLSDAERLQLKLLDGFCERALPLTEILYRRLLKRG
jgi:hypothetical protein